MANVQKNAIVTDASQVSVMLAGFLYISQLSVRQMLTQKSGSIINISTSLVEQPKVADGASQLLQDVFGKDKNPSRLVFGVASLPLGTPVELELIFEVAARRRSGKKGSTS